MRAFLLACMLASAFAERHSSVFVTGNPHMALQQARANECKMLATISNVAARWAPALAR